MTEPVGKVFGYTTVSREVADEIARFDLMAVLTGPPPTAEQIAERQRLRAERDARNRASWTRLVDAGGLVAKIAELHEPIDGYCRECGGEDAPDWPCDTAQALIEHQQSEPEPWRPELGENTIRPSWWRRIDHVAVIGLTACSIGIAAGLTLLAYLATR